MQNQVPAGNPTMPPANDSIPSFMQWKELTSLVGSMRTRSLVARPTSIEQCREALAYCRRHHMTVCARGAGRG
jgi:FAD/FMN-containing dehydrogenase